MYCFTDIYSNVSDDKKPRIACAIIDGRETAANLWLSVGSQVAGRVRGVRNPVHVW